MAENSLSEMEQRIIAFNALASSFGTIPQQPVDRIDAIIQRYRSVERTIDEIDPKFKDLPDIGGDLRPAKLDFPDDEWIDVPGYELIRCSIEDIATYEL